VRHGRDNVASEMSGKPAGGVSGRSDTNATRIGRRRARAKTQPDRWPPQMSPLLVRALRIATPLLRQNDGSHYKSSKGGHPAFATLFERPYRSQANFTADKWTAPVMRKLPG
jgi:hypothetical protein